MRLLVCALVAIVFCNSASLVFGQTASGSKFDGNPRVTYQGGAASNVSPDGKAATILFDALFADASEQPGKRVSTKPVAIEFDVSGTSSTRVKQFVRGYASLRGNVRVALMYEVNGQLTVVRDLKPYRMEAIEIPNPPQTDKEKTLAKNRAAAEKAIPDAGTEIDFCMQFESVIPSGGNYQMSCWLVTESKDHNSSNAAYVVIDSIDVEIQGKR